MAGVNRKFEFCARPDYDGRALTNSLLRAIAEEELLSELGTGKKPPPSISLLARGESGEMSTALADLRLFLLQVGLQGFTGAD
jgi:hypothetical protein